MKKYILSIIVISLLSALPLAAQVPEELPPPEKDELTLSELLAQKFSLAGKVVETTVTHLHGFDAQRNGYYRATFHHHEGGHTDTPFVMVYVPEEGKEFGDDLFRGGMGGGSEDVYVYIAENGDFYAVGLKYKKSKGTYRW